MKCMKPLSFAIVFAFMLLQTGCTCNKKMLSTVSITEQCGATRYDFEINGAKAFIIFPQKPTESRPWLWYAPTFMAVKYPPEDLHWMFKQLLEEGFYICGIDVGESYGSPEGTAQYNKFYQYLTKHYKLNKKTCLMPQSRGGLMLYNWAAENPKFVKCIAGIFTVCDIESYPGIEKACGAYRMTPAELLQNLHEFNPIDNLTPLANEKIPILIVHGNADKRVPLEANSGKLIRRYKMLGGPGEIIIIPDRGHELIPEYFQNKAIIDFLLKNENVLRID